MSKNATSISYLLSISKLGVYLKHINYMQIFGNFKVLRLINARIDREIGNSLYRPVLVGFETHPSHLRGHSKIPQTFRGRDYPDCDRV